MLEPVHPLRAPTGFSIIVATRNRALLLRRAIESIQKLTPVVGAKTEIVVVDNASTDLTAKVAQSGLGPYPVRVVRENNLGLNHARNRGAKEAVHEFLVFLDDDMEVHETWLVACHDAFSAVEAAAVCGPVIPRFESHPPPWLTPTMYDSITSTYSRKGDSTMVLESNRGHELPGCNFGVWRSVVFALGGFHPSLDRSGSGMLAGGDSEFGLRVVNRGLTTLYVPGCTVTHLISDQKTSRSGLRRRWFGLGQTARAVSELHGCKLNFRAIANCCKRIIRQTTRAGLFYVRGQRRESFEAWLIALRDLGYVTYSSRSKLLQTEYPFKAERGP